MFQRLATVLTVVLSVGSVAVATAAEPKEAGGKAKSPPNELAFDLGKGVKLEMVLIPAGEFMMGEFMMGSPDSDKHALDWEKPQHRVRITKPFYLGKYLVTQEQWKMVMGNSPSEFIGMKNPVDSVSWNDCHKFLDKLNKRQSNLAVKLQLPSEAQWEYACRAGSTTKYCFGEDEARLGDYAWFNGNSANKTHPVGEKKPNAWGLYDMHGNVWEWCQDKHARGYYPSSGPVIRGGSWNDGAKNCRSANGNGHEPDDRRNVLGFRVALIPADKAATAAEPKPDTTKQITNSIGMKLTLIPSGEFMMGSGESAEETAKFFNKIYGEDYLKDEHPQHRVRITKPFYLGTYHVTRRQFRQFVADTSYQTDAEKGEKPGAYGWDPDKKAVGFNEGYSWRNAGFEQTDEHPVVNVSWNDAVAFCEWLSKKESRTYRLPTEAEWEYACRAGTTTRYSIGDDPETLAKVGNVLDATFKAKFPDTKYTIKASDGYVFTAPVGKFKPNAFGLYDMHGNAWQWCADWYGVGYYAASPVDDPTGADSGNFHVLRGSSWFSKALIARSAKRCRYSPVNRFNNTGFRVARNLTPPPRTQPSAPCSAESEALVPKLPVKTRVLCVGESAIADPGASQSAADDRYDQESADKMRGINGRTTVPYRFEVLRGRDCRSVLRDVGSRGHPNAATDSACYAGRNDGRFPCFWVVRSEAGRSAPGNGRGIPKLFSCPTYQTPPPKPRIRSMVCFCSLAVFISTASQLNDKATATVNTNSDRIEN